MSFVKVSLVYFLVGAFWMGFFGFLPEPEQLLAHEIYNSARGHVMLLGWASFAIIGLIYYFVPKAVEGNLYSERLARIHFWITNVVVPIGILIQTYASFAIDSLLAGGLSEGEVFGHPTIAPLFFTYMALFIIGFAAQIVFVYNIYKTIRK